MAKPNLANPIYKLPTSAGNMGGLMWGIAAVGLFLLLVVSSATTQYLASALGYQEALGQPLYVVGSTAFYHPLKWAVWMWTWRNLDEPTVRHIFTVGYMIVILGSAASVMLAAYLRYRKSRNLDSGLEHLHGSAHWATREEIEQTTLLPMTPTILQQLLQFSKKRAARGVYVGAWKDPETERIHYLRHDGPEHVMAFAPTRSGKGVGLVLPTLLSWLHSVLVYDIKGEAYALTAGWRQRDAGNRIFKFEPTSTDGSSIEFNALEEIRIRTDREVSDVQNVVQMIVDPDGEGMKDHWSKTGAALLVGTILHVLYVEKDKTLTGVANFLSEPTRTLEETLNYMLGTEHDPDHTQGWTDSDGNPVAVHPVVAASARDMLNKSENEMSGVLSTSMSFLTLYRDPIVAKNTRRSQFKINDLMNSDRPVSLYLVVPPSDKDRLRPLIRLMVNQIMRRLTEKMEFKDGRSVAGYKHRMLLLIDEFPSLGKLEVFEESLAFIAGYGMKAYLIVQDIAQLWKAYGKEESIMSNCHVRIAFAPNKLETARVLSDMTGKTTVVKTSNSYSGGRMTPMLSNVSSSQDAVARALLTEDEVMRLPAARKDAQGNILEAGDMLIFVAGFAPIYGKQILYFKDPTFDGRSKIAPPSKSDRLRNVVDVEVKSLNGSARPQAAAQAEIAAVSAASHLAANPAASSAVLAAVAGAAVQDMDEIMEAEAPPPTAVIPSLLKVREAEPVTVLDAQPQSEAQPNPTQEAPADAHADDHDELPPIAAFASMPGGTRHLFDNASSPDEEAPPAEVSTVEAAEPVAQAEPAASATPEDEEAEPQGDDLLQLALAASSEVDSSYSLFDDILGPLASSDESSAEKPALSPDSSAPVDGLDDLLAELKHTSLTR